MIPSSVLKTSFITSFRFKNPSPQCPAFKLLVFRQQSTANNETGGNDSSREPDQANAPSTTGGNRRHRHRFRGGITNVNDLPTLRDFQQQIQVRSLYRRYLRLVMGGGRTSGGGQQDTTSVELKVQVKREFRVPQSDAWQIKRALAEGNARYKALAAMLGRSEQVASTIQQGVSLDEKPDQTITSTDAVVWPWKKPQYTSKGPLPIPKKS